MNAPSLLALPVARASAPSNRSNTPPNTTSSPATIQACRPAATAATQAIRKPMIVSALGDRPSLPSPTAMGVIRPRTRARVSGETSDPLTRRPGPRAPTSSRPSARACRRGERLERLGDDGVDRLASLPPRRHEPDLAQLAQVPRHERLGQPDVLDELRHGGRPVGQAADDPQPVGVGEHLVELAQLTQVVGDVDDRGEGAADSGAGGGHGVRRPAGVWGRFDAVGSTAIHINAR